MRLKYLLDVSKYLLMENDYSLAVDFKKTSFLKKTSLIVLFLAEVTGI